MNRYALLGLLAWIVPAISFAHTRWFAEEELQPYVSSEPTALYLSIWALVACVIIGIGIYLERRRMMQADWCQPKAPHAFERAASTFAMVAGAFFVIAGTHEYLFSPNLSALSGAPQTLIVLQIVVGLAFLVGVYSRIAALVLALLWGIGLFFWDYPHDRKRVGSLHGAVCVHYGERLLLTLAV